MKRTQGIVDLGAQRRKAAQEALKSRPLSQVATLAELRELVKAILDYLGIPYQEA